MMKLVLGIVLFFGMHSISAIAGPVRDKFVARNEKAWKALYGLVSFAGLVLIFLGYADARSEPTVVYVPPPWLYTIVPVLLIPAFILFFAPYFPGTINKRLQHPQLWAVILWALGHLLVNGMLADLLLFGTFLLWAATVRVSFTWRTARPAAGVRPSRANDLIVVALGLALYAVFAFWLHARWLGVEPIIGLE